MNDHAGAPNVLSSVRVGHFQEWELVPSHRRPKCLDSIWRTSEFVASSGRAPPDSKKYPEQCFQILCLLVACVEWCAEFPKICVIRVFKSVDERLFSSRM